MAWLAEPEAAQPVPWSGAAPGSGRAGGKTEDEVERDGHVGEAGVNEVANKTCSGTNIGSADGASAYWQ